MKVDNPVLEGYARKPLPTLRDMVAVLFRQRWKMLIAFIIVIIAAIASRKWVPNYEAKMKIMVLRQRSDQLVTSAATLPAPYVGDQVREEDLNSEVELLNSEDLLRKVAITTNLANQPGVKTSGNHAVDLEKAIQQLAKDLKVEAGRKSNVISVSYTNHDPRLAAQVLQSLSNEYTQKHREMRESSKEFSFFDQQTQQYLRDMEQAQSKLTDFTKQTGVVSAETERDQALGHANEFLANARQAQASLGETEQRVNSLRAQLAGTPARTPTQIRLLENPNLMQTMKGQLLTLELKRAELVTKYEPTYRLVQEVDRQIASTKSAIAAEEKNPMRDEATDQNPTYKWLEQELARAEADLRGLKARQSAAAAISNSYHENAEQLNDDNLVQKHLLDEAKMQEENYLLYAHKREEARINDALDQRGILNVALAERPVVPAVPTQSLTNFALAVLLIAGAFSVAVAFAIDLMDPTFRTPDELANYLAIPVLAATPKGVQ